MIAEIIKLRGDGLSFRKIASELNTTVGKVQYRWNKWMDLAKDKESLELPASPDFIPQKGELIGRLITPRKMLLFWDISELPKKIIKLYFNVNFEQLVPIIRIYDVTDLFFNGKNAHHYHEIPISYQNGHWFVKGLIAKRSYVAELGVHFSESDFFPLFRSNCIQTPALEIPNGNELSHDLIQFHQYEAQKPKWIDHVSTYSYYEESKNLNGKDI